MFGCLLLVSGVAGAADPPAAADRPRLPAQLVADLHGAFGEHRARAVHAKGVILEGRFTPDPDARTLTTATLFTAGVPIIVRFSDFTGLPDIPDTSGGASPRGMAIKFLMPDGSAMDIVAHSFNGFPVARSAEFSTLLQAIAASGSGVAKPTPLDAFLVSHPAARTFLTTQKPAPVSWATSAYFGVNALAFIDAGGQAHHVRYRFVPEAGEHQLGDAALKASLPDYLAPEIRARVARGPIRFAWYAQLAETGDPIDDPSIAWPESRRLVRLGTLTIDRLGDDNVVADRALAFMPGNLPPGIAIADPMLSIRNAAYPISFHERQ